MLHIFFQLFIKLYYIYKLNTIFTTGARIVIVVIAVIIVMNSLFSTISVKTALDNKQQQLTFIIDTCTVQHSGNIFCAYSTGGWLGA